MVTGARSHHRMLRVADEDQTNQPNYLLVVNLSPDVTVVWSWTGDRRHFATISEAVHGVAETQTSYLQCLVTSTLPLASIAYRL